MSKKSNFGGGGRALFYATKRIRTRQEGEKKKDAYIRCRLLGKRKDRPGLLAVLGNGGSGHVKGKRPSLLCFAKGNEKWISSGERGRRGGSRYLGDFREEKRRSRRAKKSHPYTALLREKEGEGASVPDEKSDHIAPGPSEKKKRRDCHLEKGRGDPFVCRGGGKKKNEWRLWRRRKGISSVA